MKFLKKEKGFTLIELLVVVSIIGVLSTIVLSSLGEARGKANYAKVKVEIKQLQIQAEIYNIDNNNYSNSNVNGTCPTAFSVSPDSVFESQDFFEKMEILANFANIINLADTSLISCTTFNGTNNYGLSIRFSDLEDAEAGLNFSWEDATLVLCVDSYGNFTRLITENADDAFGDLNGQGFASCYPDGTEV